MASTKELFLQNLAQTTDFPLALEISSAKGNFIFDTSGKKYLDLISGISVSNIGHCHPKVVEAIAEQSKKYMHLMVYGEYIQTPQVELSTRLLKHLEDPLNSVYLLNSGSEAIEGALKVAKRFTGRPIIIAFTDAYHGSSHGALSAMGNEEFKTNFRPLLPGFTHWDFNDLSVLEAIDQRTAAVLIEPIQGEAGYLVPNPGYLLALRDRCTEVGALLIFDEIQTGFGRTGTLFAHQRENVIPDIITLAKGMGGGMPIGAFVTSKEIMDSLKENPILGHITTFGGHPVSCAAALANLEVLESENWIEQVDSKSQLFIDLLVHPEIVSVKGRGFMLAVEMKSFDRLKTVIDRCIEKGLITDWFLFNDYSMRIAPPLPITEEEIRWACATILEAIEETK